MAELGVTRHSLQSACQLIACGGIDLLEAVDLVHQLVAQRLDGRHTLLVDLKLQVYKQLHVFLHLLWMLLHQLG